MVQHWSNSVSKGDYDFQQLSDWRDSVTLRVLGTVRGVYSSDLDEVLNRVTIGADSSEATAAEAAAIGILISLSVPVAAIHFSLGRQPVSSIGVANARSLAHAIYEAGDTSLRDDGTALAGGFEIDRSLGGNRYELCTAGLVITRNSTTYLVTASHCSSTMYNLDTGDDLYQVDAGRAIGHEAWDTTASGDDPKRNSDAALITVDTMTALRGVIARTTSRSYDTYGRIQIDTTRPYLYVYTTSSEPPVGTYVDKIGRSTGWTYGDVSGTCVDMENTETDKIIACTTKANVFTGKGDSGAALFGWDGEDGADLNGLTVCLFESAGTEVIAGDSIQYGYVSYYSGYTGFLADLGGSSGVSATAGVTISSFTDSGTVSISNPAVSWSVPTIGGSGSASATRYYLYRSTSAGEYDDQIGTYYDGTDWLDLDETVTGYNGTTRPGIHTPWVEYQVVAYNDGVTNSSTPIYFTQ